MNKILIATAILGILFLSGCQEESCCKEDYHKEESPKNNCFYDGSMNSCYTKIVENTRIINKSCECISKNNTIKLSFDCEDYKCNDLSTSQKKELIKIETDWYCVCEEWHNNLVCRCPYTINKEENRTYSMDKCGNYEFKLVEKEPYKKTTEFKW